MHKSVRHRTLFPGIIAVSIESDRTFLRHSHDEFGFGYIVKGRQDSWSGRSLVEAQAGDTITVNPGELHDGVGRKGRPRYWRMLYLSPAALADFTDAPVKSAAFSRPVNPSKQALTHAVDAMAAVTRCGPDRGHAEQLVMLALAAQLGSDHSPDARRSSQPSHQVQTVLDMIFQA